MWFGKIGVAKPFVWHIVLMAEKLKGRMLCFQGRIHGVGYAKEEQYVANCFRVYTIDKIHLIFLKLK